MGQVIFKYILYPIYFLLLLTSYIYIKSFFITITIKWYIRWNCWRWGFISVFSWSWIQIILICSRNPCNRHWSRITVLPMTTTVLKHVETLSTQMTFKRVIARNRIRGHVNLVISLLKYLYAKYSHCNFNFTGKTVPLLCTDIIMVALFCFSSVFFHQKRIVFFFFLFLIFSIKIVKSNCKAPFSYICYISNTRHSKLRGLQK